MPLSDEIKELFTFNRREQNGIVVLFLIIILLMAARVYVNHFPGNVSAAADTARFAREVEEFKASLQPKDDSDYISRLDKYIIERYDSLELFRFNPNKVSEDEWKKLGLTDKQIETIMNFRAKGGKFYDKNDFRRMYGIRTRQYLILEPFVDLPERYTPNRYASYRYNYESSPYGKTQADSLFLFDPNELDTEQFEALGLSYKQAKAVMNYRKSGGLFRVKSDFKKIYTISDQQYELLKDYINLPDYESETDTFAANTENFVDINALSEEEFKKLPDKFWQFNAKNIVKYRESLGGYVHRDQLLEVYGVKDYYYDKIKDYIAPVNSEPKMIRINFASAKELTQHPYLKNYDAEAIVEHRDQNGPFSQKDDLRKYKLVSKTTYEKLKPYITTE